LDALRERAAARRRVGYLGHGLGLYPVLTGLENLAFYAALAGLPRGSAEAAWEAAELPRSAARRPVQELSRGMQQRLALSRSLLHDPALWIVDEPDASLDEAGASLLGRLMGTRTVVMATHDRELGAALCGRALLLEAGRASPLARLRGRELVPEPLELLG
ncbi:MAG: ABC transporter ATP-binding protein, partial [Candidatus Dormibacterales bacterium]